MRRAGEGRLRGNAKQSEFLGPFTIGDSDEHEVP